MTFIYGTKRWYPWFFVISIYLFPGVLHGQPNCEQKAKTITLQTPEPLPLPSTCNPQKYTARDYVEMLPGFEYIPAAGESFLAQVDNTLILPIEYLSGSDIPDADNHTPNTSLPVGTTPGVAGVSPTGAATYQIPIHIPPGTAGMQPNISLVYNSQAGNGQLGWGWNIAGLSAITRVPQTIYHDTKVDGVSLDANDRFALDGNRLIVTNGGTYGANGTQYRTEVETFNLVTSFGVEGTGPQRFEVKTKDGLIMEFGGSADGSSADSRFMAGTGTVILWRINKITDQSDNFIEFVYENENNESRIEEIRYTGNAVAGLQPYNVIKFFYASRLDNNAQWIAGLDALVVSNLLLRMIHVYAEESIVKEYKFKYSETHTDGLYGFLSEIVEFGSDHSQLNSTVFEYGVNPGLQTSQSYAIQDQSGDIITGDFNGDGRTDMIFANAQYNQFIKYHTTFELYLNNSGTFNDPPFFVDAFPVNEQAEIEVSTGKLFNPSTTVISPNFLGLSNADFDGDGKDDFIVTDKRWDGTYNRLDNIRRYYLLGYALYPENYPIGANNIIHPDFKYFYTGDFDGDGAMDFMTLLSDGSYYRATMYFPRINTNGIVVNFNLPSTQPDNVTPIVLADQIFVIDFNGDGKSDLMVVDGSNTTVYTFNKTGSNVNVSQLYSGGYPTSSHIIRLGDFNGDGKTDLLTFIINQQTGNLEISKSLSTGEAFRDPPFPIFIQTPLNLDKLKTGDYNGDGKTDIFHVVSSGTTSTFNIYYSVGPATHIQIQYSFNNSLTTMFSGDFNGDGSLDEIVRTHFQEPIDLLYFNKNSEAHILSKVVNGFNHKTQFFYTTLPQGSSPNTTYTKGSGAVYPLNDYQGPLRVVKDIFTNDGIGGNLGTSYSYESAKAQKTGRGFLGFMKITSENSTLNRKIISTNELNNQFFYLPPLKTEVKTTAGIPISTIDYVNNQIPYDNNKRYFPFVDEMTAENFLPGSGSNITFQDFTYNNDGNLTGLVTEQRDGSNTVIASSTTATQYTTFPWWWIPFRLDQTTVTQSRPGEDNFVTVTDYGNYNNAGQLLDATTDVSPTGGKSVSTAYEYNNPFGNLTKTTTSASGLDDRFESLQYDPKGRFVTQRTNALGHSATAEYEPAFGNIVKQTDATGLITNNEYDTFGRLKKTLTPEGNAITYTRDWAGSPANAVFFTETQAPGAPDIKTFYDLLGRELRSERDGFTQKIFVDQTYNARGQLLIATHPRYASDPVKTIAYTYNNDFGFLETENNNGLTTTYSITGNTTTITNPASQSFSRTTDATGALISSTDAGGTVTYTYFSHGGAKDITSVGTQTLMEYDEYGRQAKLTDPNAGESVYDYNAFGELILQTDANGNTYNNIQYDRLGRIISKTETDGTSGTVVGDYSYFYVTTGNGLGNISTVNAPNGNSTAYEYDNFARITKLTENIDGQNFDNQYEYDNFGNLTKAIYPSGYTVQKNYNNNGYLTQASGPQGTIFTSDEMNALNQYTKYTLGNVIQTQKTYNDFGIMTRTSTTGIQDLLLDWNTFTGNLNLRGDIIKNKVEQFFVYDNLNRLTNYQSTGQPLMIMNYANNGNITSKTDAGTYTYNPNKPHAVQSVTDPLGLMPLTQNITYTPFQRPATITEGDYELTFTYGPDNQRKKSVLKQLGTPVRTITYAGNYEKIEVGGNVYEVHYIISPAGMVAINVRQNGGADQLFYVYADHLGSILTLTDATGAVVYEQNFDPWGRKRNPNDWTYTANPNTKPPWLIRGFTGHEHHDEVQLINMNARMYDPIVARMLSPDNFVQDATSTQGFNRYSYVLNNPLVYTDPGGENPILVALLISAAIGAVSGYAIGSAQGLTGEDLLISTLGGAIIGAAGGLFAANAGILAGSALYGSTGITGGFAMGAVTGGAGAAAGGFVTGFGFTGMAGGNPLRGGLRGVAIGALSGALIGGLAGGIQARSEGKTFWTGDDVRFREQWGSFMGEYQDIIDQYGENAEVAGSRAMRGKLSGYTFPTDEPSEIEYEGFKGYKSKTYISKRVVREWYRYRGIEGKQTLYHEFSHASDIVSGEDLYYQQQAAQYLRAHNIRGVSPSAYLEYRAFSYEYFNVPSPDVWKMIEYYRSAFIPLGP